VLAPRAKVLYNGFMDRREIEKKTVDIVTPCYNESKGLERFFRETSRAAESISGYDFHFIFVDDGSTDGTLKIIQDLAERYPCVGYVSFSRNFGKEAGIYAGLKHSHSDLTVVMDADLQHPPALLALMIQAIEEGYDSCAARRVSREGEPVIRSFCARWFYRVINAMTDVDMVDGAVDYRMMTRQMTEAVLSLSEIQRFSKGIFAWVGFKTKWVEFKNVERLEGESKWSLWKLFKYAVEGITAFTTVPLRFASILGLAVSLSSFLLIVFEFIKTVIYGVDVKGYPSTLIMLLLIGGIMIMSCGILGEYVARMYMETKRRPVYIEKVSNIKVSHVIVSHVKTANIKKEEAEDEA
jgi:glycosyltransferase involved in cell wall biosynthesis